MVLLRRTTAPLQRCGRPLVQRALSSGARLTHAAQIGDAIHCTWADGSSGRFHLTWLRDHCPNTVHPDSGQRTVELRHLPRAIPDKIDVGEAGRSLALQWPAEAVLANGQVTSAFDAGWLRQQCCDINGSGTDGSATAASSSSSVKLWCASDFPQGPRPTRSWSEVVEDDSALLACLRNLQLYGFALIDGCPTTEDGTLRLAERVGQVQMTFYGGPVWDTAPRAEGEVVDTAYSNVELPLHTDCAYLHHQPGLQLFNCMEQAQVASKGSLEGSTRLCDGFHAAKVLRAEHPDAFDFFSRVALPFRHAEGGVHVEHAAPVFSLDPRTGAAVGFRYNELDRAPLAPPLTYGDVGAFYAHQETLVQVLHRLEVAVRLEAGTALILNNHRVLHGRYAFRGRRNMLGAYLTPDDWMSNLRVLEARHEG